MGWLVAVAVAEEWRRGSEGRGGELGGVGVRWRGTVTTEAPTEGEIEASQAGTCIGTVRQAQYLLPTAVGALCTVPECQASRSRCGVLVGNNA